MIAYVVWKLISTDLSPGHDMQLEASVDEY